MTWLQVFISAFPQGSLWRERPPFKGRVKVSFCVSPFTPTRCRTSGQKRGVAPSTSTPLVRRAVAPGGRGDTRGAASLRFVAWDAENPCYPSSHAAFRKSPEPQRRGVRPLRERRCGGQKHVTPQCHPPPSERVTPIRRHLLDPQRRKSSIIPGPLKFGFCCSNWWIFLMAASRPP